MIVVTVNVFHDNLKRKLWKNYEMYYMSLNG